MLSCKQFPAIIYDNIKLYSQNVCKNSLIINIILETQLSFDIIFIQEPPWSIIQFIPSSTSCEGDVLVRVLHHPNWTTFARSSVYASESPRIIIYIHIYISSLCFFLWNDIINHRNLSCISFFNQESSYFLINVYSDSSQLALKYLKDTEVNINNILVMTGDFNIRDSFWNPYFPYHSTYKDSLFDIANSFQLEISELTEFFSTRYSNNGQDSNSVLDLIFLWLFSIEFDNYHIHSNWRLTSDHTPIIVNISISNKHIPTKK